jgi:hypothetical protein
MDLPKETLFPGESIGSLDFKLVRLAREFRRVLISEPQAHITMQADLRRGSLMFLNNEQLDLLLKNMIERFKDARDRLIRFGVWEQSIFGYLPVRQATTAADNVIVAFARLSRIPNVNELGPEFGPRTRIVSAPQVVASTGDDDFLKGQIVIDPFAKADDPPDPPSHVETQIEITVWDKKVLDGARIIFFKTLKVTLNVTPDRIDEIGAELSVVTLKLKEIARYFKNAQVSVKVSPKANVDIGTQARIKKWTDSQVKLSLEFEVFGVQIEPTLGLDARGKPAGGLQLTVPLPFGL